MPFPYEGETGATGPQIAKLRRIHQELIKPVSRKVQDCHQKPGAGEAHGVAGPGIFGGNQLG